jgi:hypothetical protein
MIRVISTLAAAAATVALGTATAGASVTPGPPLYRHETTCQLVPGGKFVPVTMWLSATMAAGDTFWLDDGSHYLIQSARVADVPAVWKNTSSLRLPAGYTWSDPITTGLKAGRATTAVACRGFFDNGDGTYHWVDSVDYLIG